MAESPKFAPFLEMKPYKPPRRRCQSVYGCNKAPEVTVRYLLKMEDGTIKSHGVSADLCTEHAEEMKASWEL